MSEQYWGLLLNPGWMADVDTLLTSTHPVLNPLIRTSKMCGVVCIFCGFLLLPWLQVGLWVGVEIHDNGVDELTVFGVNSVM